MSIDEIRKLAEVCKEDALFYRTMSETDKWHKDNAKRYEDTASALFDYADMVERCEKIVGECVPLLDEIFRRYGCDGTRCCHWSCPNGSPCYASIVRNVANELRKLRGDAGKEEK